MKNCRGSITVEAAILLPIFIAAIMTFVFIIKVYYVHEIVQQAITSACEEMSLYSLLYYETNADELISGLEKFTSSQEDDKAIENTWISPIIEQLGKDASDYVRAQLVLVPISKILVKKNLEVSYFDNVDNRLRLLNLKDGFEGIDFSNSRMLADDKSIDIIVQYKMFFPFLKQFIPEIKIIQTASSCVWAGEDGIKNAEEEEETECVWNMSNLNRGREIRKLQGANLPFNFPTISIFKNGTATSIKSLNIDEEYYKNVNNLKKKLLQYINKLEEFEGGESGGITIESWQIYKKELRLIIPETELMENQQQTINECIQDARKKGIDLVVIKAYGKEQDKKTEPQSEN
ncbi:pilus assembly protein [Ruminiclostridium herbifermentans]|uniref:Pilus assembly protein n=2 Tax=Ruminiclostridium herbifermentans TaxID=2488810 RepID=A0A4U7JIB5_9FIRM|nr:pilus assembly protein [Ruminiclostridium herbifermentans]